MLAEIALAATTVGGTTVTGAYARTLFRRLHTDPLTALPNRAALERAFARIQRRARPGELVGLLLGDVDHFKTYNDSRGHRFGDRVLQAIAADLAERATGRELAVRLHGDEFAVLLPGLPEVRDAEARARTFRAALASTRVLDGQRLEVSMSIGAAVDTARDTSLSALLGHADRRLYGHKRHRTTTPLPTEPATCRRRDLPKEAA
jgi:diguanylate cyclase (GGDEF)-like protein